MAEPQTFFDALKKKDPVLFSGDGDAPDFATVLENRGVEIVRPGTRSKAFESFMRQGEVASGSLTDPLARLNIARADTFPEKVRAFQNSFPEGELTQFEGALFFREDPSVDFKRVDERFLRGGAGEVLGDIIDFIGPDLGAIIGELLLTIGTEGLSLPLLLARLGIGAGLGEIADESLQELQGIRGPGSEPLTQVAGRIGEQALIGAAGAVIGEKIIRPAVNVVRGAGFLQPRTGAAKAQRAAERLDVGDLPVNLVSDNPLIQKLGGQASALLPTLSRFIENIELATARALRKGPTKDRPGVLPSLKQLEQIERAESDRILGKLANQRKTLTEGGDALKQGVAQYNLESRGRVNMAYARARTIEPPKFRLLPAISEAVEVKALTQQMGPEGAAVLRLANQYLDLAKRQIGADPQKLLNLQRQAVAANDEDLIKLLREVEAIDPPLLPPMIVRRPDGQEKIIEATDQIRFLQSQAFDLKTPAPGDIIRQQQALAGRLFRSTKAVLDDPVNTNEAFRQAWRRANVLASNRFITMESAIIVEAAKTQTPAALAARLANLGRAANADEISLVRRILPAQKFQEFQDAAFNEIIRDPFTLKVRLEQARPDVLKQLFDPKQRAALKFAADKFDKLGKARLAAIREAEGRAGKTVFKLDLTGSANLLDIVKRHGGRNGPLGRLIRSGILDEVKQRAIIFEKGGDRVSFFKLRNATAELRNNGAFRLLTVDDIRFLNDTTRVQDLIRLSPDAGTSIQAAEAAAGARVLETTALITILENIGTGRLMTSPLGRRLLVGGGKTQIKQTDALRLGGAIAAQLATDASGQNLINGLLEVADILGLRESPEP